MQLTLVVDIFEGSLSRVVDLNFRLEAVATEHVSLTCDPTL